MILNLHPQNPQVRHLERIADVLRQDGIIAYPTDTLFGLGALISRKKAVDRIQQLTGRDPRKPMSILCANLSMLGRYTQHLETATFRLLKQIFPGPYTVILPANRDVPRYLQVKQTVGLRIPDHPFCHALVERLDEPILTATCKRSDQEPFLSAWDIHEELGHLLDAVVDCGEPVGTHSTVLDLTGPEPRLLREGAGPWPR